MQHDIFTDLERTDLGNVAYKIDPKTGKNPLWNVLVAYGTYDREVEYCQGMNIVAAWLLKYYQDFSQETGLL
jgi:hypothetical protein